MFSGWDKFWFCVWVISAGMFLGIGVQLLYARWIKPRGRQARGQTDYFHRKPVWWTRLALVFVRWKEFEADGCIWWYKEMKGVTYYLHEIADMRDIAVAMGEEDHEQD